MLKVDSLHRRLPILVAPAGNFYTPTMPRDYCEGQAIADLMMGKSRYSFQQLGIREKSFLQRSKWVAGNELLLFDRFPKGWEIIEGRPWKSPKYITPEQAQARMT